MESISNTMKVSSNSLAAYNYLLKDFYKGGSHEVTLNENLDTKLFDETFIVFEIDSIKDDPLLFPLVTLIIMDVFIQKMRIKKNRKVLVIEEAWKAIASPMMAEYIKYSLMTCSIRRSSVLVTIPWVPFQISIIRFFKKPIFSMFSSSRLIAKGFIVIGCSSA